MTDIERDLRALLRAKADSLPPQRSVPRSMVRRARRRVAATAVSGLMVAAALVAGGVSGARALWDSRVQVGHTPTPSVASQPTPTAATPQPINTTCRADALTASFVEPQGRADHGTIVVTNAGTSPCTLRDRPTVALLDDRGVPYTVDVESIDPWWKASQRGKPQGWPVVALAPGASARVRVAVSTWCHAEPAAWELSIPGDGALAIASLPGLDYLTCVSPERSAVEIGPFEPVS